MGDSDEEFDRRRSRDKFRRERSDYERREERRRESWDDSRSRDASWSGGRSRERNGRDPFGRDYDRGRRERYSPTRHDMSPPIKRMRRDMSHSNRRDDYNYGGGGGGGPHDSHFGGSGPMGGHGGPPQGWGGPGPDMHGMHPHQPPFGNQGHGPSRMDGDYPTQPPMMTFKQFLSQQDDNINDQDAIKKYNEYKVEFRSQQISDFFLAHKEEEWFKAKYHPEECEAKREESKAALKKRAEVFVKLFTSKKVEEVSVDLERQEDLTKLLDAAIILMEGGTEEDLKCLEEVEEDKVEEGTRSRSTSESRPQEQNKHEKPKEESVKSEESEKKPEEPLQMTISVEQEELQKKAEEFSKTQVETPSEPNDENKSEDKEEKQKKKRHRDKTEYSYESGSESDSGSDSEPEPAPPGVEDEPPPPGTTAAPSADPAAAATDIPGLDAKEEGEEEKEEGEADDEKEKTNEKDESEKEKDTAEEEKEKEDKEKEEKEKQEGPQPLHKPQSIFLRNLAPTITKQEVEAMCKRYPGYVRVALQDPLPERRFFRRGWVTFDRTVNIKDICWNLNNIRLRDCEMGAIVNRELKQRVRPVNGITAHKAVTKADIKSAAKIIQNLDSKYSLWEDEEEEKVDKEKESFGLVSKNPVLSNITDYLVEEGSYEEEELLGQSADSDKPKESNPEVTLDRDSKLLEVLDRMILYLRIVHSFDFYSAVEYPNEDEMPHRCGIMHARGPPPPNRITQNDVNDWTSNFESKVSSFVTLVAQLDEAEAKNLGKKDIDVETEKFVSANTQELAKDKWLCPLSGKKFKGPDFVRKHIFNKHAEKIEEVKQEVQFFNNYLMDSKRPMLPENPGMKSGGGGMHPGERGGNYNMPPGGYGGQGPPHMGGGGGYNQPRPPMMYQGGPSPGMYGSHNDHRGGGYNRGDRRGGSAFSNRSNRGHHRQHSGGNQRTRQDPRGIIEYRDLDAPDDMDIF